MDYLALLKDLHPENYLDISVQLGIAISNDDDEELEKIIQKYFSSPGGKIIFDGEIAFLTDVEGNGHFTTPANLALCTNSSFVLKPILEFTKNPNARAIPSLGFNSMTLLMVAADRGLLFEVLDLLNAGADPNAIATFKAGEFTALGMASTGSEDCSDETEQLDSRSLIIKFLIDSGAKATVSDLYKALVLCKPLSPVHSALLASNPEIVNQPISENGLTILHGAAFEGDIDTVKWLISNGANIHATTTDGQTPFDLALIEGKSDVVAYLKTHGGERTNLAVSANPATGKIDVTESIQRFEVLEEKFGINLSALYAVIEHRTWLNPPEFQIWINFDLTANSEGPLKDSFYLKATAYNDAGQSIGVASTFIYSEDFLGFDSREILLSTQQRPAKIRLFPTK
ncbi:MAG: ankyrin repeat domain-containing protein [Rhodocyclaceae bacterium]|nr:ankyrin repeat domain-containing protein [Rhodocyclaceae bacterium]